MKVSVIIPFHRELSFLEECMQSLKEQTFNDIEIIIVCDHIEEDIEAFLEDYQGIAPIKVEHLEGKSGVAAARNLGMSVASGEYIYFLDSDDYLQADTLELLIRSAKESKADLVYGRMQWTWLRRSQFLMKMYNDDGTSGDDDGEDIPNDDYVDEKDKDLLLSDIASKADRGTAYNHLINNKNSVRGISVLNILIRRSLVEEHGLRFNEEIIYLSDYPFVLELLSVAREYAYNNQAIYAKRDYRGDDGLLPLGQQKGSKGFSEYVNTYEYANGLLEKSSSSEARELKLLLDKKIIKYSVSYFAPNLRVATNKKVRDKQFKRICNIVRDMDEDLIKSYSGDDYRILKGFISGNIHKVIRVVNRRRIIKRVKQLIKNEREFPKLLYRKIFLRLSMKDNWVFCESFFGKNYSDSPKYIFEYLSKNYPGKYKFIWVMDKKNTKIPYPHRKVKRFSIPYVYYLARCKYYIFNGRHPVWIKKRKGNIFLQTWHGTPLKQLVFDLENINASTVRYKEETYKQSRAWDYLIAPNQYSSDIFRRCFKFDKVMLETGYPRNDILHYANKEQIAEGIKERLGIPKNKKTILYAPTWRDDEYYVKGQYKFSLKLDLEYMREKLGEEYVILLRTHYFIADSLDIAGYDGFAFDFSRYDDISELYLISDCLITDYSSVFFDYANLKRPMLFFTYDLEKYRDILRGFYIDIEEELPGPLLFTTEEVVEAIKKLDQIKDEYNKKYDDFYNKYCSWEDGEASKRVVEAVFKLK